MIDMTKVIGFKHAKGNFKANDGRDIDYDNYVLYVVTNDGLPDGTEGSMCYELKIKVNDFTHLIEILKEIAEDYKENELILLDEAEYIAKKIQRCKAVHSVRWRIKSVSHLIKKIVRKLIGKEPSEKYRSINVNNYKTIVFRYK